VTIPTTTGTSTPKKKENIQDKIIAATTDNAANVVGSIKLCGWTHIPCFAHTLNLIVQSSLKEIDTCRKKAKAIVTFSEKIVKTQSHLNPNSQPLKLKKDVPTRWN
jgi:hypothetical protein